MACALLQVVLVQPPVRKPTLSKHLLMLKLMLKLPRPDPRPDPRPVPSARWPSCTSRQLVR